MTRFVESEDRRQAVLLPEYLDDYVAEDNPVRVIDVFVDDLDLGALGFDGVIPEATGRPAYHPGALLKIYVYGYINQIAAARQLERETHRHVEVMWLAGRKNFTKALNPAADGAGRGQYRALHGSAGNGGSSGRGTGAGQLCPPEGQDRRAQGADAGVQCHGS